MRFNRTKTGMHHESSLSNGNAGFAGQSSIDFSHHASARLLSNENRTNAAFMVIEGIEQRAGIASGNTEDHINPGLLQYSDNRLTWRNFLGE